MQLDVTTIFELTALGCSAFLLHPKNFRKARLLFFVMILTIIAESTGYYVRRIAGFPNHTVYNISVPLIVITFLLLYIHNLEKRVHRKRVAISIIIFVVFCVLQLTVFHGATRFSAYNYVAGAITLVFACVYYFSEFIKRPVHISILKEPVFWISAAILLLYVPKSIFYSVFEYLVYTQSLSKKFGAIFHPINTFLNAIFYTIISYASLCRLIFGV